MTLENDLGRGHFITKPGAAAREEGGGWGFAGSTEKGPGKNGQKKNKIKVVALGKRAGKRVFIYGEGEFHSSE